MAVFSLLVFSAAVVFARMLLLVTLPKFDSPPLKRHVILMFPKEISLDPPFLPTYLGLFFPHSRYDLC